MAFLNLSIKSTALQNLLLLFTYLACQIFGGSSLAEVKRICPRLEGQNLQRSLLCSIIQRCSHRSCQRRRPRRLPRCWWWTQWNNLRSRMLSWRWLHRTLYDRVHLRERLRHPAHRLQSFVEILYRWFRRSPQHTNELRVQMWRYKNGEASDSFLWSWNLYSCAGVLICPLQ